ncbi:MAG: glycoside hydrolase family 28 protein [Clostridia bacterium]|nr:glycoside hydrolase family 28 protein [Clostridia bacterium]
MTVNVADYINYGQNAVNEAVKSCFENGGGTVNVPNGQWKSGPIHLESNIELHLEDNAEIIFSDNPDDYLPAVFTRWEGMECYNYSPLIYANGKENIKITGKGTLYGSGEKWWSWKLLQQEAANELCYAESNGVDVSKRVYGTKQTALRPSFIQPINCKNVTLSDFTIVDGPQWTIHPVYCDNVHIKGVTVRTDGHNTDGLNPDSCENVLIEDCDFSTGDDCIAINSGMNEDGMRVARPCKNIEVRNCTMRFGHGAVVIGSAISGGVENIYMHDCKIFGTMQGIRLKSMRGRGGYIKNVRFENIEINDVTDQAIQINMFYEFSTVTPKTDTPSEVDGVVIKNVWGKGAKLGIQIKGLPEMKLKNIELSDISLAANAALLCTDVESIKLNNVNIREVQK